jgi:hypothetical protein
MNIYVDPVVSLDLDLVVAVEQIPDVEQLLSQAFVVERFPHSIDISMRDSALRVLIQRDPRHFDFVERSSERELIGPLLPVVSLEDLIQGKVWAAQDSTRRASKRQKDLADIARLLESCSALRSSNSQNILDQLL